MTVSGLQKHRIRVEEQPKRPKTFTDTPDVASVWMEVFYKLLKPGSWKGPEKSTASSSQSVAAIFVVNFGVFCAASSTGCVMVIDFRTFHIDSESQ